MNYSTKTLEDGTVVLQLGSRFNVAFDKDAGVDEITAGVESLIEQVTGVSAFGLCFAVLEEFHKGDKE